MLSSDHLLIEAFKSCLSFYLCLDVAFPYTYHFPSGKTEINNVGIVTGYVHGYLMTPEVNICFRQPVIFATLMTMPEATIDENNRLVFLKHNVRRAGQFGIIDTIAQTSGEKILPHNHFRLSILSLDSSHAVATLLRCHHICHSSCKYAI